MIIKNSIYTLVFRILGIVFGLLITIITTRFLSTEGRGEYAMLTLVSSMYITLFGGVSAAITYRIAKNHDIRELVSNSFFIALCVGFITLVAGLASIQFLPETWWFIWIFAISAPFTLLAAYVAGVLLGHNNIRLLNIMGTVGSFIIVIIALVLIIAGKINIYNLMIGWLVSQVIVAGASFVYIVKWITPAFSSELIGSLSQFGLKIGGINLVGLLTFRIDMFLVEFFLGLGTVGIYSIALIIAEFLWLISSSVTTAAYSRIGSNSLEDAGTLTAKVTRISLFLIAITGIMLAVAGYFAIPLVFGENYRPAVIPFEIVLIGVVFYGVGGPFSAYFTNQLGKPTIPLGIASTSLLITFVSGLILIPYMGMIGAAVSTATGYTIASVISVFIFLRLSKQRLSDILITKKEIIEYIKLIKK